MKFLVFALTVFCYAWSLALVAWAVLMYVFNQPCTYAELHRFAAFAAPGFLVFGVVFFLARDNRRWRESQKTTENGKMTTDNFERDGKQVAGDGMRDEGLELRGESLKGNASQLSSLSSQLSRHPSPVSHERELSDVSCQFSSEKRRFVYDAERFARGKKNRVRERSREKSL